MNISLEHRWIYSLALAGFLVLLVFVTKKSLPELASAGPERALASVDQTDPNLVGWWKFDEGSGSTAIDSSAKGHNGTLNGSPSYVTGAVGSKALSFNGTDQSVETTADPSLAGASVFTVTFWAAPTAVAEFGGNVAVTLRNGTLDANTIYIASAVNHGGTGPEVVWNNGTFIKGVNSSLTDGHYHFYAFVSRSATDHELFVDGVSEGTSNASLALPNPISNVTIGERYGGTVSHNGPIDDVRVYTRALSTDELSQLYALGGGVVQSSPTSGSTGGTTPSSPTPTQTPSGTGTIGSPGAGAHNLYVDQTLSADCPGTYSAQNRNCSGTDGYAYTTLQEASDASNPGNTVLVRGGTYQSVCHGNQCYALQINQAGSAGNLITYEPYNNETVIMNGQGFSDIDANGDGFADGPANKDDREYIVELMADYIHFSGFYIAHAAGDGLEIDGSFDQIDNIHSHDNYEDGIAIGNLYTGKIQQDVLTNVASYRNRHDPGLGIYRWNDSTDAVTDITVTDSLFYENGRDGNGNRVLPDIGDDPDGGGNADGITVFKECIEAAGRASTDLCHHITVQGSIAYSNIDDGFDFSDYYSLLKNDIAFNNGPTSSVGFKDFLIGHDNAYINDISYRNLGRGFLLRESSGQILINNTSVENDERGYWGTGGQLYNNIAYLDNQSGILDPKIADSIVPDDCTDCKTNMSTPGTSGAQLSGDPMFYNLKLFQDSNGNIVVNLPAGTVAQQVAWIKEQFKDAFSLEPGSPAIDAGTPATYVDPTTGQEVALSYYGAAPDLGALEYQVGQVITPVAPVVDQTPPANSQPAQNPPVPNGGGAAPSGGGGGAVPSAIAISNVSVSGSSALGVTVSWTTNSPASSQILYGLTAAYGSQTVLDPSLVTLHGVKIAGLLPDTTYHMQVRSKDALGDLTASPDIAVSISQNGTVSVPALPSATPTSSSAGRPAVSGAVSNPGSVNAWFVLGAADEQVRILQELLNAGGFKVSASGAGSPGSETTYFGPATLAALERFQCAKSIVCSGSPATTGYGATGPRTRAALNAVAGTSASIPAASNASALPTPTPLPFGSVTAWLHEGLTDSQVRIVQEDLNAKGYTVSASGAGSPGNETSYFGALTQAALERFQCAKLQVCAGDPATTGYGATGPRTRGALNM